MTTLSELNDEHFDYIDYLTDQANAAYKAARSGTKNVEEKNQQSELAKKLRQLIQYLTMDEFHANTANFKTKVKELEDVNTKMKERLDSLEAAADRIAEIAQILKLVDQALVIAAGVAKMA